MIEAHDGCIVNIASTAGVRGGRRRAAYCASKGGLVQLTRSLAIDHGRDGVRVNCVCPGLIDTEMADWIRHDEEAPDASGRLPSRRGRIGTPAEIADGVAYPGLGRRELPARRGAHGRRRRHGLSCEPGRRSRTGHDNAAGTRPPCAAAAAAAPRGRAPGAPGWSTSPRRSGVHVSTVSRVLNGDPAQSIRPEIYERILTTASSRATGPTRWPGRSSAAGPGRSRSSSRCCATRSGSGCSAARCSGPRERGYVVMIMEEPTEDPQAARRLPVPGRGEPGRRAAARHLAADARAQPRGAPPSRTSTSTAAGPDQRQRRGHGRGRARCGCSSTTWPASATAAIVLIDGPQEVDTVHRRASAARRHLRGQRDSA